MSLEVGSWFNLYQGNGPPRTAIRCYEPKPKRAKDIKKSDVLLNQGSACRVLETPFPKDADGEIFIYVYDIFGDEMDVFVTDDMEKITMCATWHTRYFVVRRSLLTWSLVETASLMLMRWFGSEMSRLMKPSPALLSCRSKRV